MSHRWLAITRHLRIQQPVGGGRPLVTPIGIPHRGSREQQKVTMRRIELGQGHLGSNMAWHPPTPALLARLSRMHEQRPIGFWLKLVDSLITERFAASLEEHGVTRLQWQLLNLLNHGPATGADLNTMLAPFLASVTGEDEPTDPGEHLSELVESGWVSLEVETYHLTERGATSLTRLTDVVESVRAYASAGIAVEDYDTTVRTLHRMAGNLGWRGDD